MMGHSDRREELIVAYLDERNGFVSNHNAFNFMKNLSRYVSVTSLRFDFGALRTGAPGGMMERLDAYFRQVVLPADVDFIYTNNMTLYPLLLYYRHRYGRDLNFILVPHSVLPNSTLVWLLVAPFIRDSDCVIVQSDTAKRELGKISGAFRKAVPLPHCIDTKQFALDEPIIRERFAKRRLVYVGRIRPQKNILTLVEAMGDLKGESPPFSLHIVGPPAGNIVRGKASPYFLEIAKERKDAALENHVLFHGAKVGSEKDDLLYHSTVFLNPSTALCETFGFANLEALNCGIPVLCSDWKGFNELIRHGVNGFLLPLEHKGENMVPNRSEMVRHIKMLTNDRELYRKLSYGAKKSAARYDYRLHFGKFKNVLQRKNGLSNRTQVDSGDGILDSKVEELEEFFMPALVGAGLIRNYTLRGLLDRYLLYLVQTRASFFKPIQNQTSIVQEITEMNRELQKLLL